MFKNILVNSMVNLGDVILTTSALALIKKNFPEIKITAMVKSDVKDAMIKNPVVDDVIVIDYRADEKNFRKMWKLIKEIRQKNFDLAISLDRKLRPALLTFLARIPRRVCPSKVFDNTESYITLFYTDVIKIDYDLNQRLQAETYQEIIRRFFEIEGHAEPQFPNEISYKAKELLSQFSKKKLQIALCIKGTFQLKTWKKDYFIETIKLLKEKYDPDFFIVGTLKDKEYADEIIAECDSEVKNFCGKTSLIDLVEIFKRIDLFITVDTGAAHVAATTKIKMIVIYGCTSPDRWQPIDFNAIALTSRESCCPCSYKTDECPNSLACLENVTPLQVFEATKKLLEL